MMPFDLDVIPKIVAALLVALFGSIGRRYFQDKPKLIFFLVHASANPLPPPPEGEHLLKSINTHSIVVRNAGNRTAHNVRIDHALFPLSYTLNPPINHTVTRGPQESAEILIPVLAAKEQVAISYLYFPPIVWSQINAFIKCDEGLARPIPFPSAPPSKIARWTTIILSIVGAYSIIYWFIAFGLPLLTKV